MVESRGAANRWLLPALGAALIALLVVLVMVYVRPPAGYSPRLGPERDVTSFFPAFWRVLAPSPSAGAFQLTTSLLLLALWATYGVALWTIGKDGASARVVGAVVVIAHLALVLAPPVISSDVYRYAVFGRMARAGLNPYLVPPLVFQNDPIVPYANWWNVTSNYGPSFTWLSALLARLGGDGVFGTGVAFKAAAALASVASCWLIGNLAAKLHGDDGVWAAAAYGWNPLVVLETAAMGHNEAIMMVAALLGLLLIVKGHPWPGFAALLLSADVKQVTGALALLAAVWFVASGAWLRRVLGLLGMAAGIGILLWRPFFGMEMLNALPQLLFKGPTLVGGASSLHPAVAAGFGALVVAAAVLARRGPFERVIELAAGVIFLFIVFIYPFRFPWYSIAPLALFAITARGRPRVMVFGVVVLWGAALMIQYTYPRPLA